MAKIQITAGVFGWNRGQKYELIKAGAPPIEVDEVLAQRLVEKGVAAHVTPTVDMQPVMEYDTHPDEEPAAAEPVVRAYDIGMTAKELRDIAKGYGLTFKQGISKAEMVEKLDALFADLDLAETELGAEDDVPAFDAAEAVQ